MTVRPINFQNIWIPTLVNFLENSQTQVFYKYILATIHFCNQKNSFEIEYFGFQKCFNCGNFPGRLSNFIFSYVIYLLTIHYCNKIVNYEIEKLNFKIYNMRSSKTITVMAATTAIFNTEQKNNSINEWS
jgi:hypothetical protein